jgi:RNA polymerase sigma-70 factor (ECF subfamily)
MQNSDDRQTLHDLRNFDARVIATVYDRHYPAVYRYVLYRLNDEHVAEDLASDVFVSLLEAIREGRAPHTSLKAWLFSTAAHAVMSHLRRHYRRPAEALTENLADQSESPAAEFDQREQSRILQQMYTHLTAEQQHVLGLRFGLGCSLEETARTMDRNVNAVKALQFRALAAIQRRIGEASDD